MSFFSVRSAISRASNDGVITAQETDDIIAAGGDEIYVEEHDEVAKVVARVDAGKLKMAATDRDRLDDAFMLRGGVLTPNKSAWRTFINHLTAPMAFGLFALLFSRDQSTAAKVATFALGGAATIALAPITLVTGSIFGLKRLFED